MNDALFREYDLRGKVGSELDLTKVYDLGAAIAYFFLEQPQGIKTVVIGMDGRVHSPYIKNELTRACNDSGLNVIFVGLCPTPVLYFSLHTLPAQAGIMITASHNGSDYNGMKICIEKERLVGSQISQIKNYYHQKKRFASPLQGTYKEYPMLQRYAAWIAQRFSELDISMKLTFDCLFGATSVVVPELIQRLGMKNVTLIHAKLDPAFGGGEPDPVDRKNNRALADTLLSTRSEFGIAFDGDGDRMVVLDHTGKQIPGDKLLALFAQDIIAQHPDAGVVFDVKCSAHLPKLLQSWGARPVMSRSGHSWIKHEMNNNNAIFGGELSCHFFFHDRYFGYDDGIYAALRFLQLAQKGDIMKRLHQFPVSFTTPEIRIHFPTISQNAHVLTTVKDHFGKRTQVDICTLDGVRATMPYGWGLIRTSNTQPMLSLRFESSTQEGLAQIKDDFYQVLQDFIDPHILRASLTHYE